MPTLTSADPQAISQIVLQGGVVAYPTEAVYGLGCLASDAQAIQRLLEVKRRDPNKGMIVLVADPTHILPWVSDQAAEHIHRLQQRDTSWVMPCNDTVPELLRGQHNSIAVRYSAHPQAYALAAAVAAPLVSTSANYSGEAPFSTLSQLSAELTGKVDAIMAGELGGASKPSRIQHIISGEVYRD